MRCPRCSAGNSAGMRFCGQCGAALGHACPSCGASNPPEHRFCGQCGAPLATPGSQNGGPADARGALPGEMKQVTVLFCDIVGSVPLTDRLGSEAMRDLVSSFLGTSLDEVHRYGGTAPQFTGDGFMALFGAPVTQEDHVRRALLAAIAIQRALSGQPAAERIPATELSVRIGVHTGPVVFGPVSGNFRMDPTAIGATANVAARLQEAAEPGTILVSEATHRLAQDYTSVEPVGPLALKGKEEPVTAYRLLDVSHRRSGLRESPSPRTTAFVDRDSERAILHNFLQLVESGHSQIVGIAGDPGIGKSRLIAEFRRELADGRVSWVESRCVSYATAIPYWLLLDLLRNSCAIVETDIPETIIEKVRLALQEVEMDVAQDGPVLFHLLGIKDPGSTTALLNPETVKAKAFDILSQININRSRRRALVLVLEDLHWVDKISEEFIGFLAENGAGARILLLATYRPGYRPPWIDKSYAGQTPLQPLSRDDSLQVVRSVLDAQSLVDLVTEEIVTRADGNPFFLEQLALHAGEAKERLLDFMVPNTIHDVMMARIDRLPAETKQLLQTTAVIGREFSSRLLHAVWQGSGSLEAQLDELIRLDFIYERVEPEGTTYVFRHALTQEAAYGTLLGRHRRIWHGAIGQALEQLYSGRAEEVAELLALHFGHSDDAEKAVDYAILAAEKAQRRWANNEALTYFDTALRRLGSMPETEANRLRRCDAVLKQAEVRYPLGQYAEHILALQEIRSVIDEIADPPRRAAWHYWTGFLHSTSGGRPEDAIEHCQKAAEIASTSGLNEISAFAESCLAQVYTVAGRLREAIAAGERALASFEARGDLWWAARTLWFLSIAANGLGKWKMSVSYCRRGLEHGIALNEGRFKSIQAVGWWRMGSAYIQQGDLERGIQCCDEALALKPIPRDTVMAKAARAYAEIKAGRADAGIVGLNEALAWFNRSDLRYTRLFYIPWLAEGHLRRGDRAAARPLIDQLLKASRETGYLQLEGRGCWLLGECLASEDPASAENHLELAIRLFEAMEAQNDLAKAMLSLAALRQRAGDLEAAHKLLDRAGVIFEELGTRNEPPRVKAALTALANGSPLHFLSGE
jgi:class 3 adenylate cyclase/tetratricopeptide (TPR) repeat protein